jgi:hypothetical protein
MRISNERRSSTYRLPAHLLIIVDLHAHRSPILISASARQGLILECWPETGSVSRVANEIFNLQILNGAEGAKSARMPNRSCKSLAKFIFRSSEAEPELAKEEKIRIFAARFDRGPIVAAT